MRPGHVLCLCAVAGAIITAGSHPPPDAELRARQLIASAVAHQSQGRNQLAIEELSQVVTSKALSRPDLVRALYDRGVAYDSLGNTPAAVNDYTAALRLDPRFAPALNNRANAYRRTGRLAEAKRDYLAALACPGGAREYSFYGLGQIAEKQGDAVAARGAYHKALSANPAFALAALSIVALDKSAQRATAVAEPQPADVIVSLHPQAVAVVPDEANPEPSVAEPRPGPARVEHRYGGAEPPKPAVIAHAVPVRVANAGPILRRAIVDANKHGVQIQLGAFREQEAASQAWNRIVAAFGSALQGLAPVTTYVDVPGKGQFWRLRAAVSDTAEARRICAALVAKNQACLVARD